MMRAWVQMQMMGWWVPGVVSMAAVMVLSCGPGQSPQTRLAGAGALPLLSEEQGVFDVSAQYALRLIRADADSSDQERYLFEVCFVGAGGLADGGPGEQRLHCEGAFRGPGENDVYLSEEVLQRLSETSLPSQSVIQDVLRMRSLLLVGGLMGTGSAGRMIHTHLVRKYMTQSLVTAGSDKDSFIAKEEYYARKGQLPEYPQAVDFGKKGHVFSDDFVAFLREMHVHPASLVLPEQQRTRGSHRWGSPQQAKYPFLRVVKQEYDQKVAALTAQKPRGRWGKVWFARKVKGLEREYYRRCDAVFLEFVKNGFLRHHPRGLQGIIDVSYLKRFEEFVAGEYLLGLDVRDLQQRVPGVRKRLWSLDALRRRIPQEFPLWSYLDRFVAFQGVSPVYMEAYRTYIARKVSYGLLQPQASPFRQRLSQRFVSHPHGELGYLMQRFKGKRLWMVPVAVIAGFYLYLTTGKKPPSIGVLEEVGEEAEGPVTTRDREGETQEWVLAGQASWPRLRELLTEVVPTLRKELRHAGGGDIAQLCYPVPSAMSGSGTVVGTELQSDCQRVVLSP